MTVAGPSLLQAVPRSDGRAGAHCGAAMVRTSCYESLKNSSCVMRSVAKLIHASSNGSGTLYQIENYVGLRIKSIQDNYPPIVIHAATTQSWGINLGRHIPKSEWCIMCTFSEFISHLYKPKCDTGEIAITNSQPIFGVLPFLSPAAAVLVLAEMSKLQFEKYPINSNFIDFSMKAPFNLVPGQRGPRQDCVCREQQSKIYDELRGDSKFWKFCKR